MHCLDGCPGFFGFVGVQPLAAAARSGAMPHRCLYSFLAPLPHPSHPCRPPCAPASLCIPSCTTVQPCDAFTNQLVNARRMARWAGADMASAVWRAWHALCRALSATGSLSSVGTSLSRLFRRPVWRLHNGSARPLGCRRSGGCNHRRMHCESSGRDGNSRGAAIKVCAAIKAGLQARAGAAALRQPPSELRRQLR